MQQLLEQSDDRHQRRETSVTFRRVTQQILGGSVVRQTPARQLFHFVAPCLHAGRIVTPIRTGPQMRHNRKHGANRFLLRLLAARLLRSLIFRLARLSR